ncbi:MAG TPA: ABC transporter permease [Candidatus Eisenbacteria bacterium]|nr:ABC transporter permease [Candidatus Eisenbacteria bacterium]
MIASARRMLAMARKEFRQLVRDRLTLGMIVGIPSLQLVLFGYAINLDVRHIPTAVLDRTNSALSRRLVGELEATQTFRLQRQVASEVAAFQLLERSEVGAVIVIPSDLDRHLYRGRGAEISIFADASNPTVASAVALAGEGFGRTLAGRLRPFRTGDAAVSLRMTPVERDRFEVTPDLVRADPLRVEVLPFYNPERRTAVFIVPGLIGVILTMTMMLMTALAIVRERERGTFEFLIATPIRRGEVMVGKILPYLVVGHVQVAIVLGLGWSIFDVPVRGRLVDLGLGALPFLVAMLALGLVVSSIARTQFQATQLSFFFFLPSMLLSGFMFPFEAMPVPAQWIGQILPLTHFLRIARGVLLKGAPIDALLGEVAAIGIFTLVALGLAIATFRKRLG